MPINNYALVIIWEGREMPTPMITEIANVLVSNGVATPELLTMKQLDSDELAKAIINHSIVKKAVVDNDIPEKDHVKEAVMFIGKRFESTLANANGNYVPFALSLSNALREAKNTLSFNSLSPNHANERAIVNAVEIIATKKDTISTTLARKYHFNQKVVDVIAQIYKSV